GITEIADLKNIFDDRNPVISDFGCSTGKFAEPDVNAFGELFISSSEDGQAINYLGNSSWGYVSTSVIYPKYFYEKLLLDTSQVISQAHFLAKVKLFNEAGFSDANRVFNYCNLLFGDPLIEFALPQKPNFAVYEHSFFIVGNSPLDLDDSVTIKIIINNLGSVPNDSLQVNITDNYQGNPLFEKEMKIKATLYKDVIFVNVPVKDLVGEHILKIELDKNNRFDELSKQDNVAEFHYVVFSTSVRALEVERFYNSSRDSVKLLNPVSQLAGESSEIIFSVDDNKDFQSPDSSIVSLDTVITNVTIQNLDNGKRYWWQARLNFSGSKWSEPYSFFNEENNAGWFFNHSFNEDDTETENVIFDSTLSGWILKSGENVLEIGSAGSDDGEFGSIKLNDQETLPNTFYWGIATALIDSITLEPSDFRYFLYWDPAPADSLISYIGTLPAGTLLAMTICADGAQALLGSTGSPVRQAIELMGSFYVDSVAYRDSWCILGRKGAPQGSVLEAFSRRFEGRAEIDTSLFVVNQEGWLKFPVVGKTAGWENIIKNDSLPPGTLVDYYPLAIKDNNTIDTLNILEFVDNLASLSHINSEIYPRIQVAAQLYANDLKESPKINSLQLNFIPPPELGTNYQVVSISSDSVLIGEDVNLSFYVYNVGETTADSFNVIVDVINDDNSRETIFEQSLDSLGTGEKQYFEVSHNTLSGSGSKTFLINIDADKQVTELYEDNNFYTIAFFIKPDTTTPLMNITFDGYDIIDGDYISDKPLIKIELSDPSLLPITDPSSVEIYLNDELIPPDTSIISYHFSETNPKVTVEFIPELTDGEYFLRVLGKDASGNLVDSVGVERYFLVSNETKILYVYNYPNPFKNTTNFTFKLTQIPDEIKIKIFTIAGRLVKEIKLSSSQLKYDFNKIYWNGKDEDGDRLANGVYLYKVIMKAGDKTEAVTQKLAIVR
ncbi:MAG: interleukin-like EMT inducer domain-containing protein, partial [Ignavibacteriaceae bacterium]